MEETFNAVFSVVAFGLLLAYFWQQRRARREALHRGAVRSRVLHVRREVARTRTSSWLVTTSYDVPGHGELVHYRRFEDEGPALLFERLHREGSEHDVYPDGSEPGKVFTVEDFKGTDAPLAVTLVVMGALAVYCVYWLAREFVFE